MRLLPQKIGEVTEGTILLDNKDIYSLKNADMRLMRGSVVSMIFQDPMTSLNPVITVGDQILEALELHNTEKKSREQLNERVDEILTLVGITPSRKGEYPHQFSGGMKQRIVIAIALACEPKLILADEPTTALDVTIQAQVLQLMKALRTQYQTSMILITHDLGVVAKICDKVAVVYAGQIIESGTLKDIYTNKQHPYTIGLFNSLPDIEHETSELKVIKGLVPDPSNLPKGCKFNPRCPYCTPECCENEVEMTALSDTHSVRCIHVGEFDREA
jgi:peptide/nickel transport system ATP-binding protein